MTEYIIDWGGIGARLVELYEEGVPPFLWTKRLREERLRERVLRCRDCKWGVDGGKYCAEGCADSWDWRNVEPDGFCSWGERRGDAE